MGRARDIYDVVVIGGGASGLAAAIAGARAGASTCIVELDVACGIPILATGNGRCNISNARLDPNSYRHPDAARRVFGTNGEERLAEFFASLGIATTETAGRLYPITRRADSVRDALLGACERLGVHMRCGSEVASIQRGGDGIWQLALLEPERPVLARSDDRAELRRARKLLESSARMERSLAARSVVVAVGGASESLCAMLGIPHLDEEPVLCPIACELHVPGRVPRDLAPLDGIRVEGVLALKRKGAAIAYEQGEVLFRTYGISGIAAFNLSRKVEEGDVIEIDLFGDLNDAALTELLRERERAVGPFRGDAAWFDGMLARPLAKMVCEAVGGAADKIGAVSNLLHRLPMQVSGLAEQRQAQVRRGGIPLSSLDLEDLGLSGDHLRGLYACGEALDMDADCGGFNLAWAWTTGMRAGACASASAHDSDR